MPDTGATGLDACKVRSRRLYEEVATLAARSPNHGLCRTSLLSGPSSACCPHAGRRRKRGGDGY
jgi:hypothetical protein